MMKSRTKLSLSIENCCAPARQPVGREVDKPRNLHLKGLATTPSSRTSTSPRTIRRWSEAIQLPPRMQLELRTLLDQVQNEWGKSIWWENKRSKELIISYAADRAKNNRLTWRKLKNWQRLQTSWILWMTLLIDCFLSHFHFTLMFLLVLLRYLHSQRNFSLIHLCLHSTLPTLPRKKFCTYTSVFTFNIVYIASNTYSV